MIAIWRLMLLQVMSSKQLALVMVHAYPYMPILETLLDTLAVSEGYPSHEEVVASSPADPMTAAWKDFDAYAMYIHKNMFCEERSVYVPLSKHRASSQPVRQCRIEVNSARQYVLT